MSQPSPEAPNQPPTHGFGHSNRRIAAEIGIVVGGLVAVVLGLMWAAGAIASSLIAFISPSVDVQIGRQSFESPAFTLQRCENPKPLAYVKDLAEPLLEALGPTPYEFRFQVVKSPEINAFALPGGFVTVNIGLLEAAESGEEVAAVLAHEIHHVTLRHGARRVIRRMGGFLALSLFFGGTSIEYPAYLLGELGSLQYDRDEETASDVEGLALLRKANIDPRGLARFFERIQKDAVTPPALLSTHPDPGDRARRGEEAAKGAGPFEPLPSPEGLTCE